MLALLLLIQAKMKLRDWRATMLKVWSSPNRDARPLSRSKWLESVCCLLLYQIVDYWAVARLDPIGNVEESCWHCCICQGQTLEREVTVLLTLLISFYCIFQFSASDTLSIPTVCVRLVLGGLALDLAKRPNPREASNSSKLPLTSMRHGTGVHRRGLPAPGSIPNLRKV